MGAHAECVDKAGERQSCHPKKKNDMGLTNSSNDSYLQNGQLDFRSIDPLTWWSGLGMSLRFGGGGTTTGAARCGGGGGFGCRRNATEPTGAAVVSLVGGGPLGCFGGTRLGGDCDCVS